MINDNFEILALNGLTGECLTTDDVLPILYLPTSTPEFERGIWEAVIDSQRDWDETEKEYLRRNDGIRDSIIDWCTFMNNGNVTDTNLEFLRPYLKD